MEEKKGSSEIVNVREISSISASSTMTTPTPPSTTTTPPSTSSTNAASTLGPSLDTPLQRFQEAVGITSKDQDKLRTRPGPNIGIYKQVIRSERYRMYQYYACSVLLHSCILLQIIFAATLTALGASDSPHTIITIFGAINTALAGILALMKGQGLPMRLRQDWQELRAVRDYIEERERCFEEGVYYPEEMKKEVEAVSDMYKAALKTAEDNRPDTYAKNSKDPKKGSDGS